LITSILGQQISWLAARSITHKFIRLYDPSLPEKVPDIKDNVSRSLTDSFPTPSQVAVTPIPVLRSVGLSGRKAEYGMYYNCAPKWLGKASSLNIITSD
jgi:DNA-3-methyladenine glycosylase II